MRDERRPFLEIAQALSRSERACARRYVELETERAWLAMRDDMAEHECRVRTRG